MPLQTAELQEQQGKGKGRGRDKGLTRAWVARRRRRVCSRATSRKTPSPPSCWAASAALSPSASACITLPLGSCTAEEQAACCIAPCSEMTLQSRVSSCFSGLGITVAHPAQACNATSWEYQPGVGVLQVCALWMVLVVV